MNFTHWKLFGTLTLVALPMFALSPLSQSLAQPPEPVPGAAPMLEPRATSPREMETAIPNPNPTVTNAPGPSPTHTSTPGPNPTVTSAPGPSPTYTSVPGPSPTVTSVPNPSPTFTSVPGPYPTVTSVPGPNPTYTSVPSPYPTVTSVPGPSPTATPWPNVTPTSPTPTQPPTFPTPTIPGVTPTPPYNPGPMPTPGTPMPTATPKPGGAAQVSHVYIQLYGAYYSKRSGELNHNNSIEAIKGNAVGFRVYVRDSEGYLMSGKTVTLSATLGTLNSETILSSSMASNFIRNSKLNIMPTALVTEETVPSDIGVFESNGIGGWGGVTATVEGVVANMTILCHRVKVKDFSSPQLLRYNPNSANSDLSNPKLEFTIEDEPKIGAEFQLVCTIHSLDGHRSLAQREWVVTSAGKYSKQWKDFFSPENDPGEGIYPFQITAKCTKMNEEVLKAKGIEKMLGPIFIDVPELYYLVTGSDWKASKNLTIKPRTQNAWSLRYDEGSDTTKLSYIVDIHSENGKKPQKVRVDVYDPELNKVGEVTTQTIEHTVVPDASGDGKTFTYYFNGPIKLDVAGDYHFIVEAQSAADDPSAEYEDKDAGKWAIEQNSRIQLPTYTLFGGYEPAVGLSASPFSGSQNNSPSKSEWYESVDYSGTQLERAGFYAKMPSNPSKWWSQRYVGKQTGAGLTFEDMIGHSPDAFRGLSAASQANLIHEQTMQYTAVWGAFGHGFGGDIMAHWTDAESIEQSRESEGISDARWSFLVTNAAAKQKYVNKGLNPSRIYTLNELPNVWNTTAGRWSRYPLTYVRLAAFLSCESATTNGPDLPGTAAAMGAKSAVGIVGTVQPSVLHKWSCDFFRSLMVGWSVETAAEGARFGPVSPLARDINPHVMGVGSTTLTDRGLTTTVLNPVQNPQWGDGKGPG